LREVTFDAGATALNVAIGPESGPPLVLLHGVTRCWRDYMTILPQLAIRWHVHALDFRGHGRSERAPGYRVIDYVADVVALLRDYLTEPAVILGHSLGAMVATAAAAEAPERVRALVLEDPPFEMGASRIDETMWPALFAAYRSVAGSERPVDEVAAALAAAPIMMPGDPRPTPLGSLRDAVSLRFQAACLRRLDPEVLDPILERRWLDGFPVAETLGRIACPTLLLQGDSTAGGALPDRYAAELASLIPRAIHVRMPGVGHQIHANQAEDMTRLVAGFLESID
jgi:pimeloyl-ACP methyl ester carboxylesterase